MQCKKVKRNLTAYLDGEIQGRFKERMAGHIEACPSCREKVESLAKVRSAVEGMGIPPFTDSLAAPEILEKARSGTTRRKRGGAPVSGPQVIGQRLWWPALGLASVLFLVAVWRFFPLHPSWSVPTREEMIVAEKIELFENLDLFEDLSVLEMIVNGERRDGEAG